MKKIVCIIVLACLVLSAAFAQQKSAEETSQKPAAETPKEKKNSFGVDLFQLLKGFIAADDDSKYSCIIISVGYEVLVAPHFSFGVDGDYYILKMDKTDGYYFAVAAAGRYYPMSTGLDKFFIGTTVGYNTLSWDRKKSFEGLFASLKVGYKLIIDKSLYLEPSMSYVLSKSGGGGLLETLLGGGHETPTPLGWNGGLRLGLLF